MKQLITVFLFFGIAIIYFGCSDDGISNSEEQLTTSLEKKIYLYFSGTSESIGVLDPGKTKTLPNGTIHIRGLIAQTNEIMSDARVTGIVTWVVNMNVYPDGSDDRWGTGELIIPDEGRWDMNYYGWFVPGEGLTYEVDGHGKGDFRGLKAHWTYYVENLGGIFDVQGYIVEK
jgi:hypothetical protein